MVNTFLPYSDFRQSARVLDNKRLLKQRVEAYQIIKAIETRYSDHPSCWIRHPAAKQWIGYVPALKLYCNEMIDETIRRGFNNHMEKYVLPLNEPIVKPWWIGYAPIHAAHQASLLRKHPDHYKQYFRVPSEYMDYAYIWVVNLPHEIQTGMRNKKWYPLSALAKKFKK